MRLNNSVCLAHQPQQDVPISQRFAVTDSLQAGVQLCQRRSKAEKKYFEIIKQSAHKASYSKPGKVSD